MTDLESLLTGTVGLDVIALVSLWLTVERGSLERAATASVARCGALAIAVHAAHFAEEFATGFHVRFPALLGLVPWPAQWFVALNVAWIGLWVAALAALPRWPRVAVFPIWFLALGCLVNGIAHPLFALASGGYFPGLVSSPVAGVVGVVLCRRLASATCIRGDV